MHATPYGIRTPSSIQYECNQLLHGITILRNDGAWGGAVNGGKHVGVEVPKLGVSCRMNGLVVDLHSKDYGGHSQKFG